MDKRGLTNLSLAVAVAALGALAWFKPGAEAPDEDAGRPLVFGTLEGVARLEVVGPAGAADAPRWTLERRGDGWWIAAPFDAPADATEVEGLVRTLSGTRSRADYPAATLDATATGLATPMLELVIDGRRYAFGGTDPINYRRYLQADATVHLVDDLLHYRLAREAAAFASRRLLPPGSRIARLQLPGRTLAPTAAGGWSLTPEDPRIGADALAGLIGEWSRAEATFVRSRVDGVVQARVVVTLEGGAAPIEFQVLTAVDGLSLHRPDLKLEYVLPSEARARLLELAPAASPLPAAKPD